MADEARFVGVNFGLVSLSLAASSLFVHDYERVDSIVQRVDEGRVCQSRGTSKPMDR